MKKRWLFLGAIVSIPLFIVFWPKPDLLDMFGDWLYVESQTRDFTTIMTSEKTEEGSISIGVELYCFEGDARSRIYGIYGPEIVDFAKLDFATIDPDNLDNLSPLTDEPTVYVRLGGRNQEIEITPSDSTSLTISKDFLPKWIQHIANAEQTPNSELLLRATVGRREHQHSRDYKVPVSQFRDAIAKLPCYSNYSVIQRPNSIS